MPALARDFEVVAVDQRGIGLSDKPRDGYDIGTLANDLAALMDALGHRAVRGVRDGHRHADRLRRCGGSPRRVDRLVVSEAPLPGISPSPPVFPARRAGGTSPTARRRAKTVEHYVKTLAASPEALRGSFEFYRAIPATAAQNEERKSRRLPMPVLAIGGAESGMEGVETTMTLVADDVQGVVLAGAAHWVAEQAPEALLETLTTFLAPYREATQS